MKKEMFTASTSASASTESITLDSVKQALLKFKTVPPAKKVLVLDNEIYQELKKEHQKFNDNLDGNIFNSMQVFESNYFPNQKLVQKRTHRRSRINKKWRKKYGFKPPEKVGYVIDPAFLSLNYLSKNLYRPELYNFKD